MKDICQKRLDSRLFNVRMISPHSHSKASNAHLSLFKRKSFSYQNKFSKCQRHSRQQGLFSWVNYPKGTWKNSVLRHGATDLHCFGPHDTVLFCRTRYVSSPSRKRLHVLLQILFVGDAIICGKIKGVEQRASSCKECPVGACGGYCFWNKHSKECVYARGKQWSYYFPGGKK